MSNYTLKHTENSTLLNAVIKTGNFSEIMQYEFKEIISDYKIEKVFETLNDAQKENIGRNKLGFKQFVRAILIAYPTVTTPSETHRSRGDEGKRYISRVAPHVNMKPTVALRNYVSSGTLSAVKYKRMIDDSPTKIVVEEEKLVYIHLGEFVLVSGTEVAVRGKGASERYIYAMFATKTKD